MPAATVEAYLAALPEDRRAALNAVREVIRKNLDSKIEEGMQYGVIGYYLPHSVYPPGYHCNPKEPLPYMGLGSGKGHMSLHLMCAYGDKATRAAFEAAWKKSGKKLDMGAACLRFKKLEDLALEAIAQVVRSVTAEKYVARYEANLAMSKSAKPRSKAGQPAKAKAAKSRKQ
jgi:Domain of unknown function (DU1801)